MSKVYRRTSPGFQMRTLKSALLGRRGSAAFGDEPTLSALDDVSFEIARGESFGLVGGNGSGKSTLLKLIAGILKPTAGTLTTSGRVAALIELGAGFHPEISGRENIFINGAVLGLSRREIEERYDRIVEFSGLGGFLEEPVKNYSSGMYVRLGFAVAIHTDPEILLVDEVLAVGDEAFAHRCLRRIEELLAAGRTVIFVSHALGLVEELCDRVLWLDHGRVRLVGEPRRVVDAYRQQVAEEESAEHRDAKEERERSEGVAEASSAAGGEVLRWGSGEARISAVRMLDAGGAERYHFESGDDVTFEIDCAIPEPLDDLVFGVGIFSPRGVEGLGHEYRHRRLRERELVGRGLGATGLSRPAPRSRRVPGRRRAPRRRRSALRLPAQAPLVHRHEPRGRVGVYLPEHRWTFSGGARLRRTNGDGTPQRDRRQPAWQSPRPDRT
ncbi:MAG: ABC transporter ATP-binding protein [Thermoanaerobaculia bacterium]